MDHPAEPAGFNAYTPQGDPPRFLDGLEDENGAMAADQGAEAAPSAAQPVKHEGGQGHRYQSAHRDHSHTSRQREAQNGANDFHGTNDDSSLQAVAAAAAIAAAVRQHHGEHNAHKSRGQGHNGQLQQKQSPLDESLDITGHDDDEPGSPGRGEASQGDDAEDGIKRKKSTLDLSSTSDKSRKQNSSCDVCRGRKVKCVREAGEEKCNECKRKNTACTHFYVEMVTKGLRRPSKRQKAAHTAGSEPFAISPSDDKQLLHPVVRHLFFQDSLSYTPSHAPPPPASGASFDFLSPPRPKFPSAAESRLHVGSARATMISHVVQAYFSFVHARYDIIDQALFHSYFGSESDQGQMIDTGAGSSNGAGTIPSSDVIFAVILAWGSLFSESPILVGDRKEAEQRLEAAERSKRITAIDSSSDSASSSVTPVGISRIAQGILLRAVEVFEANKSYRHATLDNAKAALLLEPLLVSKHRRPFPERPIDSPFHINGESNGPEHRILTRPFAHQSGTWQRIALSHLMDLGYHTGVGIATIHNSGERRSAQMTWRLASGLDAYQAALFRRKAFNGDEDETCGNPEPSQENQIGALSPHSSGEEFQVWLAASKADTVVNKLLAKTLWSPPVQLRGVAVDEAYLLIRSLTRWSEDWLDRVRLPEQQYQPWDFSTSLGAANFEMGFHVKWILLWEAMDEVGCFVAPVDSPNPSSSIGLSALTRRVNEEAFSSALRIAEISSDLADAGWVRLDAGAVCLPAMIEAAYLLARFNRKEEAQDAIRAIRQYGRVLDLAYELANDLDQLVTTLSSSHEEEQRQPRKKINHPQQQQTQVQGQNQYSMKHQEEEQAAAAAAAATAAAAAAMVDNNTHVGETAVTEEMMDENELDQVWKVDED